MLDNLNYSNDCLSTELENKTYKQDPNNKIDLISRKSNELVYAVSYTHLTLPTKA